jgi:hypothetical protein
LASAQAGIEIYGPRGYFVACDFGLHCVRDRLGTLAMAGAVVFGGAIAFRLLWDTAAASNPHSGQADQFWTKFIESRPVSKSLLLIGAFMLMVAALIKYVDPSNAAWAIVGWSGITLLLSAIILRFAWNS